MKKRPIAANEHGELCQALQVATLDALMSAHRWEPGDSAFQGGTSLHLACGSPRFSEDLDFRVNADLRIYALSGAIELRLVGSRWLPPESRLSVSVAEDPHNRLRSW